LLGQTFKLKGWKVSDEENNFYNFDTAGSTAGGAQNCLFVPGGSVANLLYFVVDKEAK
jgi:hypothetical protein